MVVALAALFVALGGVGVAAIRLGPRSIGRVQLRNGSVTYPKLAGPSVGAQKLKAGSVGPGKLQTGAVGVVQIDTSEVQARVDGRCPAAAAAAAVDFTGGLNCGPSLPAERGTGSTRQTLTPYSQPIATKTLTAGFPWLVLAAPEVSVDGTAPGQSVVVNCTLASQASATASQTATLRFEVGPHKLPLAASMLLLVASPASVSSSTAGVLCNSSFTPSTSAAPKVLLESTIHAVQTQSVG
jgi:hypothetical protein